MNEELQRWAESPTPVPMPAELRKVLESDDESPALQVLIEVITDDQAATAAASSAAR